MTTTQFFSQNWEASAGDVANGYINNWALVTSHKIRLLHISLQHDGARHVKLYVYPQGQTAQYNLVDDNFADGVDACWNGSMILSSVTSIGAQMLTPVAGDKSWLRVIWEEL